MYVYSDNKEYYARADHSCIDPVEHGFFKWSSGLLNMQWAPAVFTFI